MNLTLKIFLSHSKNKKKKIEMKVIYKQVLHFLSVMKFLLSILSTIPGSVKKFQYTKLDICKEQIRTSNVSYQVIVELFFVDCTP